jgi:hypothetical protein
MLDRPSIHVDGQAMLEHGPRNKRGVSRHELGAKSCCGFARAEQEEGGEGRYHCRQRQQSGSHGIKTARIETLFEGRFTGIACAFGDYRKDTAKWK